VVEDGGRYVPPVRTGAHRAHHGVTDLELGHRSGAAVGHQHRRVAGQAVGACVRTAAIGIDGPLERHAGGAGHSVDHRLGPDLVEGHAVEGRGVEGAHGRAGQRQRQGWSRRRRPVRERIVVGVRGRQVGPSHGEDSNTRSIGLSTRMAGRRPGATRKGRKRWRGGRQGKCRTVRTPQHARRGACAGGDPATPRTSKSASAADRNRPAALEQRKVSAGERRAGPARHPCPASRPARSGSPARTPEGRPAARRRSRRRVRP
jgi:hypothetical protein